MLVKQIVGRGLADDVGELYKLKLEEVASLERMAEKSAQNFWTVLRSANSATCGGWFSGWASCTWALAWRKLCAGFSRHGSVDGRFRRTAGGD